MGQVRCDTKTKVTAHPEAPRSSSNTRRSERRFQPSRRHAAAAAPRCAAELPRCISGGGSEAGDPERVAGDPETVAVPVQEELLDIPRPGPDVKTEGVPSVEMAWLWRMTGRMEEEAGQVAAFLARHGLDRYLAVLSDLDGLGNSMEALRHADAAALEGAGIPASPRDRLLAALRAEAATEVASLPVGTCSASPAPVAVVASAGLPKALPDRRWGCLGRAPPGWHKRAAETPMLQPRVPQCREAAAGPDEGQSEEPVVAAPLAVSPPATPGPFQALAERAADCSVGSRPSSSGGAAADKVCCYQCFKQVRSQSAMLAESEEGGPATSRSFCSESCRSSFRKALAERTERGRLLSELRESVLGAQAGKA